MKNKTRVNKIKPSLANEPPPALSAQEGLKTPPGLMNMVQKAPSQPVVSMVVVDAMVVKFRVSSRPPSAAEALALIEAALRGDGWPLPSAPAHVFFDNGELELTRSDAVLTDLPIRDGRHGKAQKDDDQIRPTA